MSDQWYVYLLRCKDDSVYTGITNDVSKRMKAHKSGAGSKYVSAKGFDCLLYVIKAADKSEAAKIEYRVKQRRKYDKMQFFREHEDRVPVL